MRVITEKMFVVTVTKLVWLGKVVQKSTTDLIAPEQLLLPLLLSIFESVNGVRVVVGRQWWDERHGKERGRVGRRHGGGQGK